MMSMGDAFIFDPVITTLNETTRTADLCTSIIYPFYIIVVDLLLIT